MAFSYLLTLDCVSFHQYLETILASNSGKVHRSPWLFTDAAETIFNVARRRVYIKSGPSTSQENASAETGTSQKPDEQAGDEYWAGATEEEEQALLEVMRETEGVEIIEEETTKTQSAAEERPAWLPPGIEPVLEEQPKWHLLAEVMDEIEQDLFNSPYNPGMGHRFSVTPFFTMD
jgi:DNA excision repair protein ERCC-4